MELSIGAHVDFPADGLKRRLQGLAGRRRARIVRRLPR